MIPNHTQIQGVLPVIQTPWNDDESIDVVTLEREIHWLYDQGADGIVVAMVSEILRMSSEEREQLATLACRYGLQRGPVIISVGAESHTLAQRFARHAQDAGASAVMAIPPTNTALGDSELVAYYARIIRSVSIPVIVQDASGYVGRPMSVSTQARIMNEFGADRVFFKPEAVPLGPRLSELRDATKDQARIFEGSGGIALVDNFRRGIAGTMPGADLIVAIIALWKSLRTGDNEQIYRVSGPLGALVALQTGLDGFLSVEKYLLHKQGVFRNQLVRGPVGFHLDDETRAEVDRLYGVLKSALLARRRPRTDLTGI